jgi:xanthine dehydrogenase YagS FAD-binding subunit
MGIQNFFNPLGNARYPDEVLTEIQIPQPSKQSKQSYLKYSLREPIDFAIVSVASIMILEDHAWTHVRIVLGGVAPTPVRATKAEEVIKGQAINTLTAERAAEAAVQGAKPLGKNGYKVEITKTLIKRALLSQG